VSIVWICSVLYNIPRCFERVLVTSTDPLTNQTRTILKKSLLRENSVYFLVYKTVMFLIVRFLVPFSALAFFNTCLIRAINASSRRRDRVILQLSDYFCCIFQLLVANLLFIIICLTLFNDYTKNRVMSHN